MFLVGDSENGPIWTKNLAEARFFVEENLANEALFKLSIKPDMKDTFIRYFGDKPLRLFLSQFDILDISDCSKRQHLAYLYSVLPDEELDSSDCESYDSHMLDIAGAVMDLWMLGITKEQFIEYYTNRVTK